MSVSIPRRLFTVDEYYRMASAGVFKPDERVELLDGEIVPMNPIGSEHAWCVTRLNRVFSQELGGRFIVWVQNPLRIRDRCEPEPDVTVVRGDAAQDRHPEPGDTVLVIEVADTSLQKDRMWKRAIYARAQIPEYWIVDLNAERIEVYRDPVRARYRSVALFGRGDTVSPLFAPDLVIDVATILGKPPATPSQAES